MRLERGTYAKIALIVLLCLGVCGFFGGCGRGVVVVPWGALLAPGGALGCAGLNATGEIAGCAGAAAGEMAGYAGDAVGEVADATLRGGSLGATTSDGGHFEIDPSEVKAIDLNWLAGSGSVLVVPDGDTGGKIVVNETVRGGSAPVMACSVEDGVLSIDYMEGGGGLSGCSLGRNGGKDVELLIPESVGCLDAFSLETASGEYAISGEDSALCDKLELGVASGSVSIDRGVMVSDLELNLASGKVVCKGSVGRSACIDQSSGEFLYTGGATPETISGTLTSGHILFELSVDTQLRADVNKTSGNFTNDFADSAGDPSSPCDLSFDVLSGNLEVRSVEY